MGVQMPRKVCTDLCAVSCSGVCVFQELECEWTIKEMFTKYKESYTHRGKYRYR